ncbi:hypothetical protein [Saliphagus infecundisoli]|uniref:Uncharacterized protein n=1 Tax=Saliphagus infecundisoli TaxID=1849069 RepID=A0ABD5QCU4_9EURY|nr:hypothetical protein [Saliphagus infecundisoli]
MPEGSDSILQDYVKSTTLLGGILCLSALIIGVLIIIGAVILNIFQKTIPGNPNTELIGIFINGILTLGLLSLYLRSAKTQESQEESLSEQAKALNSQAETLADHTRELSTQIEILAEQRDLAKYSQQSIVSIGDFTFIPLTESQERRGFQENVYLYYSEFVELEVLNYGEAPAHNFYVELYILADDEECQFLSPLFGESWEDTSDMLYSEKADPVLLNNKGAGIFSSQEKQTMSTTLFSPIEDVPSSWLSTNEWGGVYNFLGPSGVLEHISDNIDGKVIIGTSLWFEDGTGMRGPEHLRWAQVSTEDLIGRNDYRNGDHDIEEDRLNLNRILHDIGAQVDEGDMPDLQHPAER